MKGFANVLYQLSITTLFDAAAHRDKPGSSSSPRESIDLGVWKKTGSQTYSFKEKNITYDSSGT
jgi:hypothetical protein